MDYEFWKEWGFAGVVAGILLTFVLGYISKIAIPGILKEIENLEKSLGQLREKIDYIYYNSGGKPLSEDDSENS